MPLKLDSVGKQCKHVIICYFASHCFCSQDKYFYKYLLRLLANTYEKCCRAHNKRQYFEHPCFVEKRLGKKTKSIFVKFVY